MLATVIILTVLGGALPLTGIVWAGVSVTRTHRQLADDLAEIREIAKQHDDDPEAARPLKDAVRRPAGDWISVEYHLEETQRALLQSTLDDLRGPGLLAAAGVVLATSASLLSLAL